MPLRTEHDRQLISLAAAQFGVIAGWQLRALGVDRSAVRRRVRAGILWPMHDGVFHLGAATDDATLDARLMGAVLLAGPGAALSHDTAAARHGIWKRPDTRIHVTTCRRGAQPRDPSIEFHRPHVMPAIQVVRAVAALHPAEAILGMGVNRTSYQVANALDELAFLDPTALELVEQACAAGPRRVGLPVVRAALRLRADDSAGTRSGSEDFAIELIARRGLATPFVNVRGIVPGAPLVEPDLAWVEHRLVVEIDGPYHDLPAVARQDAIRDARLAELGWRTLRIRTRHLWRDPARQVDRIVTALQATIH